MPAHPILIFPDIRLTQPSAAVDPHAPETARLIQDLKDTLYAGPGVGVAAPQIGIRKQLSVIDIGRTSRKTDSSHHGLIVLLNPILLEGEGEQFPREGCLSVPDWLATVRRYQQVHVQFIGKDGKITKIKAHGFEALALQHEIDHLKGLLFLDRVSNIKTNLFRRKSR